MPGIVERIGSLAGTELAKAADLAHSVFQDRMQTHGHTGRAIIETIAEICRNHPNLVGIGVGLLVEQILLEEKRRHDAVHPRGGRKRGVAMNGQPRALRVRRRDQRSSAKAAAPRSNRSPTSRSIPITP